MAKFVQPSVNQIFISDFPHLLKEWDYQKNKKTPNEVRRGSPKKYFWICPKGHSYSAQAMHRTSSNSGCPVCKGKLVTTENSLANCAPEVAALIHPSKNPNVDPDKVHVGAHKKLWWQCGEGHEWKTSVKHLTASGSRCPKCLPREQSVAFCHLSNRIIRTSPVCGIPIKMGNHSQKSYVGLKQRTFISNVKIIMNLRFIH